MAAVVGGTVSHAQFRPEYWELQAETERQRTEQARVLERAQYEAMLTERSARAHARMENEGAVFGVNGDVGWQAAHPDVFGAGLGFNSNFAYHSDPLRNSPRSWPAMDLPVWQDIAPLDESIETLFSAYISQQIVQSKCVTCHVEGGASGVGISRLQFVRSTTENHVNLNRAVFEDFVDTAEDPVDLILNKIQGVGHGGGIQVTAGSVDFANLERFLRQLANDGSTDSVALTAENLFDGVTMASPQKTLRRAAILFAGRLPTQEEVDAVRTGFVPTLRNTIRGLMEGQGFHDFLIDASNDRLLTDRQLDQETIRLDSSEFVALNQKAAEMRRASLGRGFEQLWRDPDYWTWEEGLQIGLARAPLELIAHVVENDLPYQEILTADYIMANPMAAEAYGASTRFDNVNDPFEFKPSAIDSYYRNDDSKVIERDDTVDLDVVTNAGNLSTDYPHAGILNTTAFLRRYPSTATNRNRARSRWTYYYFLGLDVEKSASRTTDAAALADTNNPTMNNAACTVCHVVLDPVAGAFQNYGDEGLFRHEDGGLDSLPNLYKYPQEGSSLYVQGDTWYRNMRNPGFGDLVAPDASSSVSWLTQQIVADNRFSESAVRFWWPAIMGTEILNIPEHSGDPDFQGRLAAATAQDAEVKRLALLFRFGIAGGEPYNARDLLTEIALTPWFRAESVAVEDPVREAALREAGVARLLTPEELNRKTDAVSGFVWGRRFRQTMNPERGDLQSHLDGGSGYELLFGGIDSDGIITRGTDMTPVMAAVAQSHAAEVSCPIVRREFFFWEEDDRLLFDGVTRYDTPVSEVYSEFDVAADSWETRETFSVDVPMTAGSKTIMLGFANDYEEEADRNLNVDRLEVLDSAGDMVTSFEPEYLGNSRCGESQGFFNSYITIHGSGCFLDIPVEVFEDDTYQIDVVAHQDRAGGENARMTVAVESDDGVSAGATAIRNKLVDLHAKLYGLDVLPDSRDVDEAFNLFFEVWARKRRTEGTQFDNAIFECHDSDHTYYDEFSDVELKYSEWGGSYLDRDEVNQLYEDVEMSDPVHAVRAWVVTLAFLMTDYRYLYF